MKRTYRGPIIERKLERGIVASNRWMYRSKMYALAVDEATGDMVLLVKVNFATDNFHVSFYDPTCTQQRWTETP